jgi:TIM-barrel protein
MSLYVRNLLAQSAMAGWSDGPFCRQMAEAGVGMVTMGGFNLDAATHGAALIAGKRRREFLIPPSELSNRICEYASQIRPAGPLISVNLRFVDTPGLGDLCRRVAGSIDLMELNAHCRQPEFLSVGSGEALASDTDRLLEAVKTASNHLPTIVKIRAMDMDPELPAMVTDSGGIGLHLDLMVPGEARADLELLRGIRESTEALIIGNNSVVDGRSFVEMLGAGADMASMARALTGGPGPIFGILGDPTCIEAMGRPTDRGYPLR